MLYEKRDNHEPRSASDRQRAFRADGAAGLCPGAERRGLRSGVARGGRAAGGANTRASAPLRRGTLEVVVANSTLVQELGFQKQDLLKTLAELLPDEGIQNLRFRVGNIE